MRDKTGNDEKELTRLVEDAIDKGASTAEEIHRAVGELPITVLESLGLEETANDFKKIQERSIDSIYGLIRDINHKVADLATDLLEQREDREEESEE